MTTCAGLCAEVLVDLRARRVDRRLTYRVPASLRDSIRVGHRVVVPLGPRTAHGFVLALHLADRAADREIREIAQIVDSRPLFSPRLLDLANWLAADSLSTLMEALRCMIPPPVIAGPKAAARPPQAASVHDDPAAQAARLDGPDATAVRSGERPVLVWGDEGARQAYLLDRAVGAAQRNGQVIITVPEIALVPDLLGRARAALGDRVVEFHSGMRERDRRAAWFRIAGQETALVVGTRSALFAPFARLGLIIVDQEEDSAYKAEAAPRYQARDVALRRGVLDGARVILGSAAPSMETFAEVAAGRMDCMRLPRAAPAAITLVDMRTERARGRRGILSQPLVAAMRRHLRSGGQVALFVHGAGYARVLLCRECGHTMRCPRCEVTMAYDRAMRTISCRICGQSAPAPAVCPRCGGVALRWIGAGTERVEEIVRRLFPALRVARIDRDTEKQFARLASEFTAGRIRLVVGTQLLLRARRLRPTLVGAVDADLPLFLPDFRAGERALQQLRAVASLASGGPEAEAVFQTRVPDHPVIAALRRGDDERLYRRELEVRREFGYPPFTVLAQLLAVAAQRDAARDLALRAAEIARRLGVDVLGPSPARDPGARGTFRYRCLLRSPDGALLRSAARATLSGAGAGGSSRLVVEMNP